MVVPREQYRQPARHQCLAIHRTQCAEPIVNMAKYEFVQEADLVNDNPPHMLKIQSGLFLKG